MINHDTIFNNLKCQYNFVSETDVSVLKFERTIFEDIIKQFSDIKKELCKIVDDSMNLLQLDLQLKSNLNDGYTKKLIA